MYAPPWARDGSARDTVTQAAENALEASAKFRSALPPASQVNRRSRWRDRPFEGDLAAVRLRERPTLDPVAVPEPPARERGGSLGLMARVVGAVGLAALAAFFMVGTAPLSLAVKAEGDGAPTSFWSRFSFVAPVTNRQQVALNTQPAAEEPAPPAPAAAVAPAAPTVSERFPAVPQAAPPPAPLPVQTVAVPVEPPAPPPAPAPSLRSLSRDEIASLYRRGEELVAQGDIASARLLLARAAEAGDARSALALGATYDPTMLTKLGVVGVAADAAQARAWYAKAAEFGSGEASRRLEQLAQSAP